MPIYLSSLNIAEFLKLISEDAKQSVDLLINANTKPPIIAIEACITILIERHE